VSAFVPSLLALGPLAIAAGALALHRESPPSLASGRGLAARALALATIVQALHFAEELGTGLPARLGPLFGLPPMSTAFFVAFNVAWLTAWIASVPLLRGGVRFAFFAAWFLALAGFLNGVAHPLLAIASGGYFPGLVSSLPLALVAARLWRELRGATAATRSPRNIEGGHS
jgi:hypothetical protein